MAALEKRRHELFVEALVKGLNATQAYISAGYSARGATQSAARLLRNANILARLSELRETLAAEAIAVEVRDRNARLQSLQRRWQSMQKIIDERAVDPTMKGVAGASSGLITRDYRGKDGQREIFRLDVGLLQEMRAIERQAAIETGQWSEEAHESKTNEMKFDGTLEELLSLYRRITGLPAPG